MLNVNKCKNEKWFLKIVILLIIITLTAPSIQLLQFSQAQETLPPKTVTESQWSIGFHFQPYSIDIKSEILQTSFFSISLWSWENSSSIRGVVLKNDRHGSSAFGTDVFENTSDRQRILFQVSTDPEKVQPWTWKLHPVRPFGLGSPVDHYSLSVFIAVNATLNLGDNSTTLVVPQALLDEWDFNEKLERFDKAPNSFTLIDKGLDAEIFADYMSSDGRWKDTGHIEDYYLYTITIAPKATYVARIAIAFLFVPIIIFVFLIFTAIMYLQKRLTFSNLLTIYLAVAFFIMPFLISFYQYAPPVSFTWQEFFLLADFVFSTFLVISALLTQNRIDRTTV